MLACNWLNSEILYALRKFHISVADLQHIDDFLIKIGENLENL
jgi:hypothetical protein